MVKTRRTINNSVEFRSGPSHLEMIMLGRPTFEVVMAFARWHATARATLPRDGFLHETSMPSVTLVKGGVKLVTSRLRLDAGMRQQYQQQWSRRVAHDRQERIKAERLNSQLKELGETQRKISERLMPAGHNRATTQLNVRGA